MDLANLLAHMLSSACPHSLAYVRGLDQSDFGVTSQVTETASEDLHGKGVANIRASEQAQTQQGR